MRHIKLFEIFGKDDYYSESSGEEFINLELVDASKEVYDKLIEMRDRKVWGIYRVGNIIVRRMGRESFISINIWRVDEQTDETIVWRIWECSDEWFFVEVRDTQSSISLYYKCDQFEGLVELLKDKGIIKV
jgi:hypothetical protein